MASIEDFKREIAGLAVEQFVQQYSYPFLLVGGIADSERMYEEFGTSDDMPITIQMPQLVTQWILKEKSIFPIKKKGRGSAFSFVSIGRSRTNDIVLNVGAISKLHAVIQKVGEAYTLMDSGSRNGTFVNGIPLDANKPVLLNDGDLISFASVIPARFLVPSSVYQWVQQEHTE